MITFIPLFFTYFFMIIALFQPIKLLSSSLDGTSSFVYKNQHHVFHNGDIAQGFVRMGGGFTVKSDAKATLDIVTSVSGSIDLRETGTMQLMNNLFLDTGTTFSSGGYIKGFKKSLILNDNVIIPSSKILHIIGDTIIDGNKKILKIDNNAQIIIESNSTLTLKNITVQNTHNNQSKPCIKVANLTGKLSLDNVNLKMIGDWEFAQGKLFIHNDVIFSGTSAFIYSSPSSSFIAPASTLYFDIGTTFSFTPDSTNNQLFVLQDQSSSLFLNGSSLKVTSTGMRMTKGNLILDNKVLLQARDSYPQISGLSLIASQDYGTFGYAAAFNPTQNSVLAIAGGFATSGNELQLFTFDGSSLTSLTSKDYGNYILTVAWNPAGNVIAVGGNGGNANFNGLGNFSVLRLYGFNGVTLSDLTTQHPGTYVSSLAWNPAGNVLAVGGEGFSGGNELLLYTFNGSTLSSLTSQDYGTRINALSWSPDGTVLAIGGAAPVNPSGGFSDTNELRIYTFNGSTLTALTSQDYGSSTIFAATWDMTGSYLAVGGNLSTDQLKIYYFDGATLSLVTQITPGGIAGSIVRSLAWHPTQSVLACSGSTNGNEIKVYSFDGASLTELATANYGTGSNTAWAVSWNQAGDALGVNGQSPSDGNEIKVFSPTFSFSELTPSAENRIIFGNSSLGSSYNLNVEVLGKAHVIIDGRINEDSA